MKSAMQSLFSQLRRLHVVVSGIFLLSFLIGPEKTGWGMAQMPPKDTSTSAPTQNEVPVGETNPDQPTPSPEASGAPSTSPATSDQFVAQSDSTLLTDGDNTPAAPEESETAAKVSNTDGEEEILATDPLSELSPATLSERPAVDHVDGVTTYYVNGAFQIAAPDASGEGVG